MSNALAIAAVTAALKDLISAGLLGLDLSAIGNVVVSALPPDRIATGQTEPNQINVFLYRVTPNTGWCNTGLPARDGAGQRVGRPPLALDLHYLVTTYGAEDLGAEALLGLAMQILHETPGLGRERLRALLGPPNPPFGGFSASSLAEQIEWLKITPDYLDSEELSKLWAAMQARYRPSMAYQVSAVLIESDAAVRAALPVLRRGPEDRGPVALAGAGPVLGGARPLQSDLLPAARLGDLLALSGKRLSAANTTVLFENARTGSLRSLPALPGDDANGVRAQLPTAGVDAGAMADWSAGVYALRVRHAPPGQPAMESNAVPLALSPRITVAPLASAPGTLALSVVCSPRLHPLQHAGARLLFGDREFVADSIDSPVDDTQPTTLAFTVTDAVVGSHPVRLRVDGIDSLPVVAAADGFAFDPQQTVVIA
jgi:hypothetical protein